MTEAVAATETVAAAAHRDAKPYTAPMHQRSVDAYDVGKASRSEGVPGGKQQKVSSIW